MKVALLGTGLIGGSIGLAIKKHQPTTHVTAFDRDGESARRAVERGAADDIADSATAAVADADFVFISTPVGAIAGVAAGVASALKAGAVLTDVGSTKSRVVLEVETLLPPSTCFIGGHPMAGTEEEGIDAADAELFEGAWWILTPTDRSDMTAYQRLHGLLATLRARVMALKPSEHDELMAIVSHVPQLTASTLMNVAAERGREHAGLLALAAGGFRDVTRIAASNPQIWLDVCEENRDAIAATLGDFAARLLVLRDLIASGDRAGLQDRLVSAREARRNLPGKSVAGELYEVRMPVPDRPGLLAEVTTTVGNIGVNIEDLQITHATEGGRGTLHLQIVGPDEAEAVASALAEIGLDPRVTPA